jgi:triosephosphate isomerase
MADRTLVIGNWKMNHTQAAARLWCEGMVERLEEDPLPQGVLLGVAPPFTALETVARGVGPRLILAGQNVHWETSGAFTGEVSAEMLAEVGCRMAIIGHSERRHVFGENDERISRKVAAAREAGLTPILCVGETEEQRDAGRTELVIEHQLRRGLERFELDDPERLVVAYEPVWAIGTGRTATADQAQEAHAFLRNVLASVAGAGIARQIPLLYGGSVKPGNAAELAREPDVDGFLVGGASLEAASLLQIAREAASD